MAYFGHYSSTRSAKYLRTWSSNGLKNECAGQVDDEIFISNLGFLIENPLSSISAQLWNDSLLGRLVYSFAKGFLLARPIAKVQISF